jgi:hypothetical protein
MKKTLFAFALFLSLPLALCFADGHGNIAVQSELRLFSMSDLYQSISSNYPTISSPCEIGVRLKVADMLSIDLMAGAMYASGSTYDSASQSSESPSIFGVSLRGGIAASIHHSESAELNFLGDLSLSISRQYEGDYNSSTTSFYGYKYAYYMSITPSLFIGLEPSYNLSKNFSLFSKFGIIVIMHPATKYIDTSDPTYDFDKGTFPLKDRKDGSVGVAFDGLLVGFRYWF